jgi:hypothetical protein
VILNNVNENFAMGYVKYFTLTEETMKNKKVTPEELKNF